MNQITDNMQGFYTSNPMLNHTRNWIDENDTQKTS